MMCFFCGRPPRLRRSSLCVTGARMMTDALCPRRPSRAGVESAGRKESSLRRLSETRTSFCGVSVVCGLSGARKKALRSAWDAVQRLIGSICSRLRRRV